MTELFLKVFNMSLAASWVILAAVLLRLVLRRAPKWINPLLWCVVGIRLVCPFSIRSALSLIPSAEVLSAETVRYDPEPAINSGLQLIDNAVNPAFGAAFAPAAGASVNPLYVLTGAASVVWLAGLAAMLGWALASWLILRRRVKGAERGEDGVYRGEAVAEPFVLGVLRPGIYLPPGLAPEDEEYVLAHERAHIARRDTWAKPLGWVILSLHWFNPLAWLAYALFCRDIEFACDERVIKTLTPSGRADYSAALLRCGTASRRAAACPLAFGESGVKSRVKGVLNYRKPAFWLIIAAIIALAALAVFFLTDPADVSGPDDVTLLVEVPEELEQAARGYVADIAAAQDTEVSRAEVTAFERRGAPFVHGDDRGESSTQAYAVEWRLRTREGNITPEREELLFFTAFDYGTELIGASDIEALWSEGWVNYDSVTAYGTAYTAGAASMYKAWDLGQELGGAETGLAEGLNYNVLAHISGAIYTEYSAAGMTGPISDVEVGPVSVVAEDIAAEGPDGAVHLVTLASVPYSWRVGEEELVGGGDTLLAVYSDENGSLVREMPARELEEVYGGDAAAAVAGLFGSSPAGTPAPGTDTPDPEDYSPAAKALISDLALARVGEDDERQVRETVRIYLMLKSELEYHPGWKEPDFEIFFDAASPDYAALEADIDYSREMAAMMAESGYEVIWDNVTVDFNSVEIDGDRASVDCYCTVQYISSQLGDMFSGAGCQYWIELRKADGCWLLSGLSTPPRNY